MNSLLVQSKMKEIELTPKVQTIKLPGNMMISP